LVGQFGGGNAASAVKDPNDQLLLNKLKSLTKGNKAMFNENVYKNSITVGQLHSALIDFGWPHNKNEVNFAKKILDRYDFDGDGRLNPRELIILTIIHNKSKLGLRECRNCYNDLVNKKIDPIFNFIDCDHDNKINAEDMWESFASLNRKNNVCNIYDCKVREQPYRTNAMNDFIIKNMEDFDGYLSKEEFRAGLLLGYWDRQTTVEKILQKDEKTWKKLRWGDELNTDIVCDRIERANSPNEGSENSSKRKSKSSKSSKSSKPAPETKKKNPKKAPKRKFFLRTV